MNSNRAEIEAGEWLARLDGEKASSSDMADFTRWQDADPRHNAAYARLTATWQALDRIQAVRPAAVEPIDKDYLIEARQVPYRDSSPRRPTVNNLWMWAAAFAAIAFALTAFWYHYSTGSARTFSTVVGGFQRVVLDDQSVMDLNTNSEVRVDFRPHARRVELVRGEASFEVAHDNSRPFVVATDSMAVRAVGTKFDVLRFGSSTEVTVAEGNVVIGSTRLLEVAQLAPPPELLQVSAGQTATTSDQGLNLRTLSKDGVARKLAWRSQMLVFDRDTLAEVVAQFNRYNERQIAIADPNLTTLRISGYFRPTNLDAFLDVLQSSFGIRVAASGNTVVLATDAAT